MPLLRDEKEKAVKPSFFGANKMGFIGRNIKRYKRYKQRKRTEEFERLKEDEVYYAQKVKVQRHKSKIAAMQKAHGGGGFKAAFKNWNPDFGALAFEGGSSGKKKKRGKNNDFGFF